MLEDFALVPGPAAEAEGRLRRSGPQAVQPPQQRADAQSQEVGEVILVLKRTLDDAIRVAGGMLVDPQELAVSKQQLGQSQNGHSDGSQGQPSHQTLDVMHVSDALHQDQEQHHMREKGDQAAACGLGGQRQFVPDAQLRFRSGLRRPQRQQAGDLRRQRTQHARWQRRQLQDDQQHARQQNPLQTGPAPARVGLQALPSQPADGRTADQRDVDQAADIAASAHEQRRDENHAQQTGVDKPQQDSARSLPSRLGRVGLLATLVLALERRSLP